MSGGWNKSVFHSRLSNRLIPNNQLEKHMPKYLRRKLHTELKPKTHIFEIQPTSGVLDPGERSNVQVKFMPKEEVSFKKCGSIQMLWVSLSFPQRPYLMRQVSREFLSDLGLTIVIRTSSACFMWELCDLVVKSTSSRIRSI